MKLNTLDENPPEDIPQRSDIETDKHDDPAITPDIPESIEEPKYMRLYKTYTKNDLHVSLTKLSDDEIQQKTQRKALKTYHKAITDHIPRPVWTKRVAKKCNAVFKSL